MDSGDVILPPCMLPQPSTMETMPVVKAPCPWGKVSAIESVCFNDVMSEELANVLHREELSAAVDPQRLPEPSLISSNAPADCETCDDLLLAQMMQLEFDREHDEVLRQEEKKFNGTCKVSVSYDKYLRLPCDSLSDEDDEEEKELQLECQAKRHWSNFEDAEKAHQAVGKSGVSRQGNTTTTKHDLEICGIRNASKLLAFPPCTDTGDSFDMKLSNTVYNTLKLHSRAELRRSNRIHDKKERSTMEKALDEKTCLILYKLVNNRVLEAVNGCFSTGKEAGIYHSTSAPSDDSTHKEYALKVFKTTLNEFQNRDQYIKGDHRFSDRLNRQNPRKVIHIWAEKEMNNLMRIKKANIPCPDVIALKKHVLVMSFIGNDMIPAPKLKEVKAPFEDITIMYEQTIDIMNTLYEKCELVHADLSEYNLLWHDGKVWVIDVGQAVEITHPQSLEFLLRDCKNICNFFEKRGVINVMKPEALFTQISGFTEVVLREGKTEKRALKNSWTNQSE